MTASALQSSSVAPQRLRPTLVILGCVCGLLVSIGPIFMLSFSVFIPAMASDIAWGRGQLSSLIALTSGGVIIGAAGIGPLMERFGPRTIIRGGSALCFASLVCLAVAPLNFVLFMALFFFTGVAGAGTQTFVYMSLVTRWFDRRLGLMLGVAMTGVGLGSAVGPIIAERLIESFGWRGALAGIGGIMLVVSQLVVLILLRDPPLGDRAAVIADQQPAQIGANAPLRDPRFWMLAVIFTLMAAASMGVTVHFAAIAVDRGLSAAQGARLVAVSGVSLTLARMAGGYLLDRTNPFALGAAIFAAGAAAITLLLIDLPTTWLFLVPLTMGLVGGIEGDMMPFIAKRYFAGSFERVYSWLFSFFCFGHLIGGVIMGVSFDTLGSYSPVLIAFTFTSLVSAALALAMIRLTRPAALV